MFKKNSTNAISTTVVTDEAARKAAVVREIKKTLIKHAVIKISVTAAICAAGVVITKVLEAGAEDIIED